MRGRICDYRIITSARQSLRADSLVEQIKILEEEVNKAIVDGWEPFGGVGGLDSMGNSYTLCQTVVKRDRISN
jgi:hypothetical protein